MNPADKTQLEEMRGHHRCVKCNKTGHISRNCRENKCEQCGEGGHPTSECPQQHKIKRIMIALPDLAVGRITAGDTCRRNEFELLSSLAPMENMDPLAVRGNRLWTTGRQLHMNYNGIATVAIAVRSTNPAERSELMIVVKPSQVKIASKYRIVGKELIENATKSATGSKTQASPAADVHVLIMADDLFAQTLALKVNDERFFIEFGDFTESGMLRKAVVVTTYYQYMYRVHGAGRELIADLRKHFMNASPQIGGKSASAKPYENAENPEVMEPPSKMSAIDRDNGELHPEHEGESSLWPCSSYQAESQAMTTDNGKQSVADECVTQPTDREAVPSRAKLSEQLEEASNIPLPSSDDSWHTVFASDDDEKLPRAPAVDMSNLYGGYAHRK